MMRRGVSIHVNSRKIWEMNEKHCFGICAGYTCGKEITRREEGGRSSARRKDRGDKSKRGSSTAHDQPTSRDDVTSSFIMRALKTTARNSQPEISRRRTQEKSGRWECTRSRGAIGNQEKECRLGKKTKKGGIIEMVGRAKWVCCDEAFTRVNRDLD